MTTITCRIPRELAVELKAISEIRGISKSEFVRRSIERNLQSEKKKGELSAYDLMREGCGIVNRGARDLARNPKHMKGFGRD